MTSSSYAADHTVEAVSDSASETARIGQRIKAARKARRLTLEEVAEASGLTKGFLSKIENDRGRASVAALLRICETLEIPPASLFDHGAGGQVLRRGHYPKIDFGGQDLQEFLLTPPAERRLQVMMSEIAPGGGSGSEGYSLPAELEVVFVISGRLELGFGSGVIELGPGDSFTFDPTTPHSFRASEPDQPTTVLWVLHPALSGGLPG